MKSISNHDIDGVYIFNTLTGSRIFAKKAYIGMDRLILNDITIITSDKHMENRKNLDLYDNISNNLIALLAKPPKNHDIYQLKNIYQIQADNQVSLHLYELELHRLLANCINFLLLAIIAAIICFPINRYKTKTNIAMKVISIAIFMRFASNMSESLAYSGVLSVRLAAWSVVLILSCISTAILVWREV